MGKVDGDAFHVHNLSLFIYLVCDTFEIVRVTSLFSAIWLMNVVARALFQRLGPVFFFLCSFIDKVSLCCPGWSTVVWSWLTAASTSWIQTILLPQLPK